MNRRFDMRPDFRSIDPITSRRGTGASQVGEAADWKSIATGFAIAAAFGVAAYYFHHKIFRNPRDSDFHGTTTNKRIKLTRTQLQQYDGTNPDLPIYIAIRGKVYSVGKDNPHYKPGGQYHSFAGREPNMGLAKNSTSAEHITHEISGITASEFEVLKHWAELFSNKYLCVGEIVEEDAQNPQIHPVA